MGPKIVNIISLLFMTMSVILIFFQSELHPLQKISLVISYPVLYEYSVIGRSYSLVFFLLVCYGILYSKRREHPILLSLILGLLWNTHLLLSGFVGIQSIFLLKEYFQNKNMLKEKEKKKIRIAFFLLFLFGLFFILQYLPKVFLSDGMSFGDNISFIQILFIGVIFLFNLSCSTNNIMIIFLIVIVSFLFYQIVKKEKKIPFIYLFSILFIVGIVSITLKGISIYILSLSFSIYCCCILMVSNKINSNRIIKYLMIMISLFSIPILYQIYQLDINSNYSNSKELSLSMKTIPKDSIILCVSDSICSSVIPYDNHKYYGVRSRDYFTYIVWNQKREGTISYSSIYQFIDKNDSIYYLYTGYSKDDDIFLKKIKEKYSLKKIYQSKVKSYSFENYQLYQIKKFHS